MRHTRRGGKKRFVFNAQGHPNRSVLRLCFGIKRHARAMRSKADPASFAHREMDVGGQSHVSVRRCFFPQLIGSGSERVVDPRHDTVVCRHQILIARHRIHVKGGDAVDRDLPVQGEVGAGERLALLVVFEYPEAVGAVFDCQRRHRAGGVLDPAVCLVYPLGGQRAAAEADGDGSLRSEIALRRFSFGQGVIIHVFTQERHCDPALLVGGKAADKVSLAVLQRKLRAGQGASVPRFLAQDHAGARVDHRVRADIGASRHHALLITHGIGEVGAYTLPLLSAGDDGGITVFKDPDLTRRHDAFAVHRRIRNAELADDVIVKGDVDRQGQEVPVKAVLLLAQAADRALHQCQGAAVVGGIDGKVGVAALRHIVGIRPGLVDAKAPASEIADVHMRSRSIGLNRAADAFGGSGGRRRSVKNVFLEGVSVRHIAGTLHDLEVRSRQDVAYFHRVGCRDLGDLSVHGGGKAVSRPLFHGDIRVIEIAAGDKLLFRAGPGAVMTAGVLDVVGVLIRHIHLFKLRAQIQAEGERRGIIRDLCDPVFSV